MKVAAFRLTSDTTELLQLRLSRTEMKKQARSYRRLPEASLVRAISFSISVTQSLLCLSERKCDAPTPSSAAVHCWPSRVR